mgnify:CR=1 FL=1|jgi:hypothetical protein
MADNSSMSKFYRKQRLLIFACLFLTLLFIIYLNINFNRHSREAAIMAYPNNFLSMRCINPPDDNTEDIPFVYATGQNANGPFRIAYYHDFKRFESQHSPDDWAALQTVYINENYVTSEGICVGSSKKQVEKAYKKYGLKEYNISEITSMNLYSLDIALQGIDLANTFLYVDNSIIFIDSYQGTDYWGGLGAIIFILDKNNEVVKIVKAAPTSG